jgi:hypothetical protein
VHHQLHVHPALRMLGRLLIRNWLAITLGRHNEDNRFELEAQVAGERKG